MDHKPDQSHKFNVAVPIMYSTRLRARFVYARLSIFKRPITAQKLMLSMNGLIDKNTVGFHLREARDEGSSKTRRREGMGGVESCRRRTPFLLDE